MIINVDGTCVHLINGKNFYIFLCIVFSQSVGNMPRVALLSRHPVNSSNQSQNSESGNVNMSTNSNSSLKNISRAELKKTALTTKKTDIMGL